MRSHASRAFTAALLSVTGLALAACDTNMIGGFEDDGSGGAGGGETADASTSPSASTSTASSAATGGAGASSGTGTPELPDTGAITLGQFPDFGDNGFYQVSANFQRGRPIDNPCPIDETIGSCTLSRCNPASGGYPNGNVDAGTLAFTGTQPAISLTPSEEDPGYYYTDGDEALFGASPTVTVTASGNDVPSFSATVARTPVVANLSPSFEDNLHLSGDSVTFTWDPVVSDADAKMVFVREDDDHASSLVVCHLDLPSGSLTVPTSLLAANPEVATSAVYVQTFNVAHVAAGTFDVALYALEVVEETGWSVEAPLSCDGLELFTDPEANACGIESCCAEMGQCAASPESCFREDGFLDQTLATGHDLVECLAENACGDVDICDSNLLVLATSSLEDRLQAVCLGDHCCAEYTACAGDNGSTAQECIDCIEDGGGPICDAALACQAASCPD